MRGELSRFVHRPGDAWEATAQLAVGSTLRIELHPAGGYRWSAVTSSDPDVLESIGAVDDSGVARFEIVAHRAGQALLAATTEFQGDRFGPPVRRWTMTVRSEEPEPAAGE